MGEVRYLSKRMSKRYTSSGDLPPCADMSELRFELPFRSGLVVHGDAVLGRSLKTRVTGSVIRAIEWIHTTYGDMKGLRLMAANQLRLLRVSR
jgi:hypothetical protein